MVREPGNSLYKGPGAYMFSLKAISLRKRERVSRKRYRQRQLKWVPSHGGDRGFHSTDAGGLRVVSRWKQLT